MPSNRSETEMSKSPSPRGCPLEENGGWLLPTAPWITGGCRITARAGSVLHKPLVAGYARRRGVFFACADRAQGSRHRRLAWTAGELVPRRPAPMTFPGAGSRVLAFRGRISRGIAPRSEDRRVSGDDTEPGGVEPPGFRPLAEAEPPRSPPRDTRGEEMTNRQPACRGSAQRAPAVSRRDGEWVCDRIEKARERESETQQRLTLGTRKHRYK